MLTLLDLYVPCPEALYGDRAFWDDQDEPDTTDDTISSGTVRDTELKTLLLDSHRP